MRLSTRLSIVAAVALLATAGLLIVREEVHEAALKRTIGGLLRDGAGTAWESAAAQLGATLAGADAALRDDLALAAALAAGDAAAAEARVAALTAGLRATRGVTAALRRSGEIRGGVALRDGAPVLLHALALSPGSWSVAVAAPLGPVAEAIARAMQGGVVLRAGETALVTAGTLPAAPTALLDAAAAAPGAGPGMAVAELDGRSVLLARFVPDAASQGLVAWDVTEQMAAERDSDLLAFATVAAGLAGALALLRWAVRRTLRPLAAAVRTLRALTAGDLAVPAPVAHGRDEVSELVGTVAAFRAALLDQRRLAELAAELASAAQLQQAMLPAGRFDLGEVRLAATILPARETGGDFFDYGVLPDGRLAVTVADVCGKGLRAALFAAQARAVLRAAAGTDGPRACLARANAVLAGDNAALMFVTVLRAEFDPASGSLLIASAGHPPPLLFGAGGVAVPLDLRPGRPLALFETGRWSEAAQVLAPGGALVLVSDGLTEAPDVAGGMVGMAGLVALARDALQESDPAASLVAAVRRPADAARQPPGDDMTCLVLRRPADIRGRAGV